MGVVGRLVKVEREGRLIKLWLRLSRAEKRVVTVYDFYPYFYVPDERGEHASVFGGRLRKVIAEDPSQVPELRSKYPAHYEADIPYTRRFLIDTGVYDCLEIPRSEMVSWREVRPAACEGILYRIWFLDIEVMADVLPDSRNPAYPVASITAYDTYVGKYATLVVAKGEVKPDSDDWRVLTFPDEDSLVVAFAKLLRTSSPDILVGWNVRFDVDYLRARIKKLGYELPWEGVQLFDMLEGFRRLQRRRSYKLKAIALEDGLISQYAQFSTSMTPRELAEYNKQDVWIMVELERRYGVLDFHLQLRSVVGVNELEDTLYNSILVDTALLRLARKRGVVLPSKPEEAEESSYEGAVVLEPPAGIFEGVAVFDMARYYPNIIISFNISPDTLDPGGDIRYPPTGVAFRSDRVGLISEVVRTWLGLREELEKSGAPKSKVDAVKFLANSVYGVFGHERFRLYDVRLASTVTAIGREGILYAKKLAEERGYKVLYGDTDSLHIKIPFEKAEELTAYLSENIEKYFRERYGVKECTIGLKFEKYFGKIMYFGVKKRYAGIMIWEKGREKRELVTVGLEAVRTDQSKFSQEFQEKLLELVLSGASLSEVSKFIEEARREMRARPLIEIALVKGLSKGLDEYKANAPHVRAVLYSNKYLGTRFGRGSRVYILWVRGVKGLPQTDVIAFDEDTKLPEVVVDWEKMEEVNIWQKAKPVLEVVKQAYGVLRGWLKPTAQ